MMTLSSGNLLQWVVATLLGLAVLMVNSAGPTVGKGDLTLQSILFGRPMIYAIIAFMAMMITAQLDLRKLFSQRGLTNPVIWLLLLGVGLCVAVLIPGIGIEKNHSRRWMPLFPGAGNLRFQPSEVAKWVMVIAMAWWGARKCGGIRHFRQGFLPAIIIMGLVCALIGKEDFGTSVLIGFVAVVMLWAAGAKFWHLLMLIGPAAAGVVILIQSSEYRQKRILSFLDPFNDPQGAGYHMVQSISAFGSGGLWGRGLGNGVSKLGYLPEDTTDFIFANVAEELGIFGVLLLVFLYATLIWVGFDIMRQCRHQFTRLLCGGVVMTIGFQAVMNMAVVTVMIPTKGIALPLMSSGGTGWILTAAALGLLVAADKLNRVEELETISSPSPVISVGAPGIDQEADADSSPVQAA